MECENILLGKIKTDRQTDTGNEKKTDSKKERRI